MEIEEIQESLLTVMPYWNYRISKPFKHLLDDGITLEMYYCLQIIRSFEKAPTMSELGQRVRMSKQQMTKIVNRLDELAFVERRHDPLNRRAVRIYITDNALRYAEDFRRKKAECFREILGNMDEQDQADFKQAIDVLIRLLSKGTKE